MSYTNAIFYLNYGVGSDTARTALTSVAFTSNAGVVRATKVGHGLTTGAIVDITASTSYNNPWMINKITDDVFDLFISTASGTLTITGTPVAEETFVIGAQTFTFKAARSGAGEVTISSNNITQAKNIVTAIMTDVAATILAFSHDTNVVTVRNLIAGTAGNSVVFTEAATGVVISGAGTLAGGADSAYIADRSGTVTPRGGSSWADAWSTITSGATSARHAAGDIMLLAKSGGVTSIGDGTWTTCQSGGGFPAAKNIVSSTNASPVEITCTGHGYSTNDVIQVIGHTTNASANGAWVITYVDADKFTLNDSVGIGIGTGVGTVQKINSKAVRLAAAQTLSIDRCEVKWTDGSDGVAYLLTTDMKSGGACNRITMDASPRENLLQAYYPTGTFAGATMNGYSKLSFWFKNEVAIADAVTWYIALCSDTAGATPIDTFPIPAIPSTGQWIPFTIARCDTSFVQGGNLGGNASTDVKSIALYSGATAPTASKYVYLDNFEACTTSGMNLQSLLSKNSLEQGGTESWYAIQSINGKVVLLDNGTNTLANAGRGYSTTGTSPETVTTYIRETTKTGLSATAATSVHTIQNSGTSAQPIKFQGGYNITNSNQDGETFFDSLNGYGFGLDLSNRICIILNRINIYRYYRGVIFATARNNTITTITANNNSNYSVLFNSGSNNIITTITANNNSSDGVYCNYVSNNIITTITANNNILYGVSLAVSSMNVIKTHITNNNTSGSVFYSYGINYIKNATITETNIAGGVETYGNSRLCINKLTSTGYPRIETDYGNIVQQLASAGGTGNEWKLSVTNVERTIYYPLKLTVARLAVVAGTAITVKLYFKKSSANDIGAILFCKGGQVAGIESDVQTIAPLDTNRNQVALASMTPTEPGVIEIEAWAYWLANTADENVIVDDFEVT